MISGTISRRISGHPIGPIPTSCVPISGEISGYTDIGTYDPISGHVKNPDGQVDLARGLVSKRKTFRPGWVSASKARNDQRSTIAWQNQSVVPACASLVRCCIMICNDAGTLRADSFRTATSLKTQIRLSPWRWSLIVDECAGGQAGLASPLGGGWQVFLGVPSKKRNAAAVDSAARECSRPLKLGNPGRG
jgi:hypothetical protein